MSRICDICGKGSTMATKTKLLRGHYNPTAKVRKYPNLQSKKIDGKKVKICTRCLKTLSKDTKR